MSFLFWATIYLETIQNTPELMQIKTIKNSLKNNQTIKNTLEIIQNTLETIQNTLEKRTQKLPQRCKKHQEVLSNCIATYVLKWNLVQDIFWGGQKDWLMYHVIYPQLAGSNTHSNQSVPSSVFYRL